MLRMSISKAGSLPCALLLCVLGVQPSGVLAQVKAGATGQRAAWPRELIGTWRFDKDDDTPGKKPPPEVITFSEDGTWRVTEEGQKPFGGRFRVEGDEVVYILLVDGNTQVRRRRFKIDSEGLHLANTQPGYAHYVRAK